MRKTVSGFTIVELLIVIVVITILAVITIVTYNGMQKRAQTAAVEAQHANTTKRLETYKIENDGYPGSITDCPTPSAGNLCLPSNTSTVQYNALAAGADTSLPNGYSRVIAPAYTMILKEAQQFVYFSSAERTSTTGSEFMQYVDLAPLIDQYGIKPYVLSFDIKTAKETTGNTIQVYFQNGSTARYGGLVQSVPVSTAYTHHELTFTPVMVNAGTTQSILAFYGNYSNVGNTPTVKNLRLQLK